MVLGPLHGGVELAPPCVSPRHLELATDRLVEPQCGRECSGARVARSEISRVARSVWNLLAYDRREYSSGEHCPYLSRDVARRVQLVPASHGQSDYRRTASAAHVQRPYLHFLLRSLQ